MAVEDQSFLVLTLLGKISQLSIPLAGCCSSNSFVPLTNMAGEAGFAAMVQK